jgi:dTDP-4-dehydrorhamnose 3,5-epimerase
MSFFKKRTDLEGVSIIESSIYRDDRGFFTEAFVFDSFDSSDIPFDFVQDNISFSKKNVLRGLHYQLKPFPQDKLVFVIKGKILDVVVDIRKKSPTYMKYIKIELSSDLGRSIFVPQGFAHGFLALEDTYLYYKVTNVFVKELDRSIRWDDPDIGIDWGIINPLVSDKDNEAPLLRNAEVFL